MTDIPVPTLDQITGYTVMEKMRTLAKAFIAFANEIKDNVYTEEQVRDYVTSVLLNYYTKEEVDEAIASIDLSDYYTKTETNNLLDLKRNISDSYSKTEIDTKENNITDRIDYLEENKQGILIPNSPIIIDETNNIELDGYKLLTSYDWKTDIIETVGSYSFKFKKDVIVAFYYVSTDGGHSSFNLSFFKNQVVRNDETVDLIRESGINSLNCKVIRIPNMGNIFVKRTSSSSSKYITVGYNKNTVIVSNGVISYYSSSGNTNCNIKIAQTDLNNPNGVSLFYR